MPTASNLIQAIDAKYPFARAEAWDKTGLQIGDAQAEVKSVLVAHEVTDATLIEATGHDALVVYHPLLFRPLENLDFRQHTVRLAVHCITSKLTVIAVHTALDNAPFPYALGDALAASLGLQDIEVLQPTGHEALVKLVVFTPQEAVEKVSAALWNAGAGAIGNYDQASFRARGTGTFRPLPGANPYAGEIGQLAQKDEWRLEVIVPESQHGAAIRAMLEAHPYEEVAYDVYPLQNRIQPYGAARLGLLSSQEKEKRYGAALVGRASVPAVGHRPTQFQVGCADGGHGGPPHHTSLHFPDYLAETGMPLVEFAHRVSRDLDAPNLRLVRAGDTARKVACVPGSGASYIEAAARAGCDCLVTGDIKHHDALKAQALGLSLIDTTHVATERAAVKLIGATLSATLDINIAVSQLDTNPFTKL